MKLRNLIAVIALWSVAAAHAGGLTENFAEAPFAQNESIIGVEGWSLRSAFAEFGNDAATIRPGGPKGVSQSLELLAKGDLPTVVRNMLVPALEVSAGRNNRISVDLLYENPQDFKSGVIYLSIATDSGSLNLGLTSGEAGKTGVAFVDLGGSTHRVNSPPGTFKAGTWYRFTVDLYQGAGPYSARISLAPLASGKPGTPVWETVETMESFNPTNVERVDLLVARTGRIQTIRVGRVAGISISTIPQGTGQ